MNSFNSPRQAGAFAILFALVLALLLLPAASSAQDSASGPHIRVSLLSEHQQLIAGEQNWLGVLLEPDPEWHTYWRNPGDSGEAPVIDWTLPDGVSAGDILWPVPKQIRVAHLVNYGYEGANLLMVPVDVPARYAGGDNLLIQADLSWLVCKEDCIPGWATLSRSFTVAEQGTPSLQAWRFVETRQQLPDENWLNASYEVTDNHLTLSLTLPGQGDWALLPLDPGTTAHNQPQQWVDTDEQNVAVLTRSEYFVEQQQPLQFLLTDGSRGYYLQATAQATAPASDTSLWMYALMALAGGILLNLMPCVLPVLSIKALSFSQQQGSLPIKLGYMCGILVCFNLFALLILVLRQGGIQLGWGFHMQHPVVIGLLAYLFVFIALQLLDVAPSGSRFAGTGQNWLTGNGFRSQFFTGVLAVVVASPCTAPFMAAALGVALISSPLETILLFNALGLGLGLPLTLLALVPAWQRWLPKPGQWMVTFRHFLAFPMLATVIWLVWIYLSQTSALAQLWLLSGLLLFALACWLISMNSSRNKWIGAAVLVFSIAVPMQQGSEALPQPAQDNFTMDRLNQLRQQQQVVLVNMTADWCITCKVNEQVAFNNEEFKSAIEQENVHYLIGDWTNKNPQILAFLNQYQRSGVPLYVVYAGTKSEQILPQILTADRVIDALRQAQEEIHHGG